VGYQYRVTVDFNLAPKKEAISSQIAVQTSVGTTIIPLSFYLNF